ncbi:MAG TPA: DUF4163 domain-containing protein [Allosphingosinicella sp.]|nr:DUF4163 domain-containing protein [Allosphingosinicella sp.]
MTPLHALLALAAATLQPADFLHEEAGEPLAFSYGWPAAAEAVPALREVLRADLAAKRALALEYVEERQAAAREDGPEFMPHHYAKTWSVAGRTPRLLSLTASEEAFAGGAHGNLAFDALLWDLAGQRRVAVAELLGQAALDGMTERYCTSLDAEREQRRGEPVRSDPHDSHTRCPPLAEQVMAPKDEDGDGRFDALDVLIAPYVAGPYAEGAYFAEIRFEARDLAGLPADYRSAFEAERPQAGAAPATDPADARCAEADIELPRGPGSVCAGRLTESYAFAMAWPGEAARIEALDALLRREAERQEQWLRREADEAAAERTADREQPLRFSYEQAWSVDANLPELVAASGSAQSYTGGAHGGIAYDTILLDRRRGERIRLGDLFADRRAGLAAVQASLCPALAAAVFERRGGSEEEYDCPSAAEQPVTLLCASGPRIDVMLALLNPYVIGGWAEGPYDVAFPVTAQILAALKPEYRSAFEAASQAPTPVPAASRCAGADGPAS